MILYKRKLYSKADSAFEHLDRRLFWYRAAITGLPIYENE